MNNDLISRSALFQKIQPVDFLYGHDEDAPYSGMAVDACDVEAAPAVDAVKVVRCGECERRNKSADLTDSIYCRWLKCQMRKNDFCNYGERRTE